MDPGTAIGLAQNAYKLILITVGFVTDAKTVYQKGGTDLNCDLDQVSKSIQDASNKLQTRLKADEGDKSNGAEKGGTQISQSLDGEVRK